MSQAIKLYAHPYCPSVPSVEAMLKGAKVDYTYINIHADDEARALVQEINNGFESVPTLVFADGSTLTEPSPETLKEKLNELGYHVPVLTILIANLPRILFAVVIIWAILRLLGIL